MVNIYLDTCVWGRPFDDQMEATIREDASAFFEIALDIDYGDLEAVGSEGQGQEFGVERCVLLSCPQPRNQKYSNTNRKKL